MAGGFNIFQSGLGQRLLGRPALGGPAGDYMRRPASGTNLPRTIASNAMQRFTAGPSQTAFTGMSSTGTLGGMPVGSQYSSVGGYEPPGTPQYSTTRPQPALTRFIPFTGAGGESLLPGAGSGSSGGSGGGGGWFGGFNPASMISGTGGPSGSYRTPLASLFPAFRGEGARNSLVRDYFSGPVQPSFASQFGQYR